MPSDAGGEDDDFGEEVRSDDEEEIGNDDANADGGTLHQVRPPGLRPGVGFFAAMDTDGPVLGVGCIPLLSGVGSRASVARLVAAAFAASAGIDRCFLWYNLVHEETNGTTDGDTNVLETFRESIAEEN